MSKEARSNKILRMVIFKSFLLPIYSIQFLCGNFGASATRDGTNGCWPIPTTGKLKVVVPMKAVFTEFVNVSEDPVTKKIVDLSGLSIDIFNSTLKYLPFRVDPEFHPVDAKGTAGYDHLLQCLPNKSCDIVVGDITILRDRASYVDFSLPYTESGVVWVVKNKQERNMWIFTKPFGWDLWVTILATSIFMGGVLRILEHSANYNSDSVTPHWQQLGLLFLFPIAVLAFPERNTVANNWSRFVLVVWLFVSYVLMQSYTANLTAMFTVDQLDSFSQDHYIGYQAGSFVREFLINYLHIRESKLRNYSSIEEYNDAMMKGGKNGGIDAIVDEIPYMKLFLSRYDSKYKMFGRYRKEGLGFAFPRDSPLAAHFSRAILNITEGPVMTSIEEKNFGPKYSNEGQLNSINKQTSLAAYNFGGLFIIIGSAMIFAIFCSVSSLGPKLVNLATVYSLKCFSFLPFGGNALRTNSMVHPADTKDSSNEQEIQMSVQIAQNDSVILDIDHQSGQGNSDVSAEFNESHQINDSNEIPLPQLGNADFPA